MKHPKALVLVFCKSPKLGHVKTRLSPALSQEKILSFYERMLQVTVTRATDHDLCESQIWASSPDGADFFDRFDGSKQIQSGDDLGQRMHHALQRGLESHDKVVLVGGDVPEIDADYLESAINALESHSVVLGPAEDGGYGLVGVRGDIPANLFSDIDWGTDQALDQTCRQLNKDEVNYSLLPWIWDVDTPEDLIRYEDWLAAVTS